MKRHPFFAFLILSFIVSSLSSAQTIRQRSTTEGLNISIQGHYMGWSSDYFQFLDENSGSGPGIGGRIGFGLNQRLEIFGQYDLTTLNHENIGADAFRFSHVTGGLRFNFSATTRALRPFAEVGYTYQSGKADQVINQNTFNNLVFKGGALHVGAGLLYFISLPVAISLNGSFQTLAKSPVYIDGVGTGDKADVSSFRLSAGIVLFISEL